MIVSNVVQYTRILGLIHLLQCHYPTNTSSLNCDSFACQVLSPHVCPQYPFFPARVKTSNKGGTIGLTSIICTEGEAHGNFYYDLGDVFSLDSESHLGFGMVRARKSPLNLEARYMLEGCRDKRSSNSQVIHDIARFHWGVQS